MTMLELCMECRNFHKPDILPGEYTISGGVLAPIPGVPDGAWVRIVGSLYNDGCYQFPGSGLTDETFDGAVWLMHVSPDFVALYNDINAWEAESKQAIADATAEVLSGPYSSESFAGYTYTKKTSIGDIPTTWKDSRLGFSARLDRWRKVYV